MDLTGKKSDPPPPWDQNHGIKKLYKNRVSKYGSHRVEERPATMGSAAGEGRQGWQQLGTFGQVSQYKYKIHKTDKECGNIQVSQYAKYIKLIKSVKNKKGLITTSGLVILTSFT